MDNFLMISNKIHKGFEVAFLSEIIEQEFVNKNENNKIIYECLNSTEKHIQFYSIVILIKKLNKNIKIDDILLTENIILLLKTTTTTNQDKLMTLLIKLNNTSVASINNSINNNTTNNTLITLLQLFKSDISLLLLFLKIIPLEISSIEPSFIQIVYDLLPELLKNNHLENILISINDWIEKFNFEQIYQTINLILSFTNSNNILHVVNFLTKILELQSVENTTQLTMYLFHFIQTELFQHELDNNNINLDDYSKFISDFAMFSIDYIAENITKEEVLFILKILLQFVCLDYTIS